MLSINNAYFKSRATNGINYDKKQPIISLWLDRLRSMGSFNINLYELLSIIDTCTGGFIVMSSYMLSICDTFDA